MSTQEARRAVARNHKSARGDSVWFQPKTLYLMLGIALVIAMLASCVVPHSKRDANDIVSPLDGANAPPQTPDRSAIVLPSSGQAIPASEGAGAGTGSERSESVGSGNR